MSISSVVTSLTALFAAKLPALLAAQSISNFDYYYSWYADNPKKKILCTYIAQNQESEDNQSLSVLVRAQLPGVLDDITKYVDVLNDYIRTLTADTFGYHTLSFIMYVDYPGDFGSGGAGSFILFELDFNQDKDSCD